MTNTDKVLALLKEGRNLSKIDMLNECGILNGGYPIYLLRQEGHDIRNLICKNPTTGKNYVRYFLVEDGVRRVF